ncbi:MAG: tRNA (adenine-N1)-methyltransferase [Chloroflexi bacterium]|nr:tRNA (adenine-N1)-methyltransferase [Chloroflexota bacterium]
MNQLFSPGDFVLLTDRVGRHFLTRLRAQGEFHSHHGIVRHEDILGQEDGSRLSTSLGQPVWIFRPRLQDYLMQMPRSSTILYPKDIGTLLMWADIFPGAQVLEAGAGSGALALALLRAIGPEGHLTTYDIRTDMMEQAQRNVDNLLGPTANWTLQLQDIYQAIVDGPFDRIVLDVPEPGLVARHAVDALVPGGIICSFVPNVPQVQASVEAYRETRCFVQIETYETILRPWIVRGPSARPGPAVGHTGFLTFARKGPASMRD